MYEDISSKSINTCQYNSIQLNTTQYNTATQYNTTQHNSRQHIKVCALNSTVWRCEAEVSLYVTQRNWAQHNATHSTQRYGEAKPMSLSPSLSLWFSLWSVCSYLCDSFVCLGFAAFPFICQTRLLQNHINIYTQIELFEVLKKGYFEVLCPAKLI